MTSHAFGWRPFPGLAGPSSDQSLLEGTTAWSAICRLHLNRNQQTTWQKNTKKDELDSNRSKGTRSCPHDSTLELEFFELQRTWGCKNTRLNLTFLEFKNTAWPTFKSRRLQKDNGIEEGFKFEREHCMETERYPTLGLKHSACKDDLVAKKKNHLRSNWRPFQSSFQPFLAN